MCCRYILFFRHEGCYVFAVFSQLISYFITVFASEIILDQKFDVRIFPIHDSIIFHRIRITELVNFKKYCQPLEENDIVKAKSMVEKQIFSEIAQFMIDNNCKLEQEIISWKNKWWYAAFETARFLFAFIRASGKFLKNSLSMYWQIGNDML